MPLPLWVRHQQSKTLRHELSTNPETGKSHAQERNDKIVAEEARVQKEVVKKGNWFERNFVGENAPANKAAAYAATPGSQLGHVLYGHPLQAARNVAGPLMESTAFGHQMGTLPEPPRRRMQLLSAAASYGAGALGASASGQAAAGIAGEIVGTAAMGAASQTETGQKVIGAITTVKDAAKGPIGAAAKMAAAATTSKPIEEQAKEGAIKGLVDISRSYLPGNTKQASTGGDDVPAPPSLSRGFLPGNTKQASTGAEDTACAPGPGGRRLMDEAGCATYKNELKALREAYSDLGNSQGDPAQRQKRLGYLTELRKRIAEAQKKNQKEDMADQIAEQAKADMVAYLNREIELEQNKSAEYRDRDRLMDLQHKLHNVESEDMDEDEWAKTHQEIWLSRQQPAAQETTETPEAGTDALYLAQIEGEGEPETQTPDSEQDETAAAADAAEDERTQGIIQKLVHLEAEDKGGEEGEERETTPLPSDLGQGIQREVDSPIPSYKGGKPLPEGYDTPSGTVPTTEWKGDRKRPADTEAASSPSDSSPEILEIKPGRNPKAIKSIDDVVTKEEMIAFILDENEAQEVLLPEFMSSEIRRKNPGYGKIMGNAKILEGLEDEYLSAAYRTAKHAKTLREHEERQRIIADETERTQRQKETLALRKARREAEEKAKVEQARMKEARNAAENVFFPTAKEQKERDVKRDLNKELADAQEEKEEDVPPPAPAPAPAPRPETPPGIYELLGPGPVPAPAPAPAGGHIRGEIEDEIREQPRYRTRATRGNVDLPWHETEDPLRMGYDYNIAMLQDPRSLQANRANPLYNPANWWAYTSRYSRPWHAQYA